MAYAQWSFDANIWKLALKDPSFEASEKIVSSTRWDGSPDVSPDGNWLAFVSDRSGTPSLWMSLTDGSGPFRFPFEEGTPENPRFSPDGLHIAFSARTEARSHIFVAHVETRRTRRLTSGATDNVAPSWSRDGRWVYFGSHRSGNCAPVFPLLSRKVEKPGV